MGQKLDSSGPEFGAGYSAMRRGILHGFQEGEVLCMLGCVQRDFAFDYVVQSRRALGFRRRPVCSKPGWRIGCADWVRNAAPSVAPSHGEVFLEMYRLWT